LQHGGPVDDVLVDVLQTIVAHATD